MRTIESIKENEVVNATTLNDAVAFCELLHKAGKMWWSEKASPELLAIGGNTLWLLSQVATCYDVVNGAITDIDTAEEKGYTITDAKEFIAPTGEAGESEDQFLLHLVDVVWGDVYEDSSVPSTAHAKQLIARARYSFKRKQP